MSEFNKLAIERFMAEACGEWSGAPDTIPILLDLGCGEIPYRRHYAPKVSFSIAGDYTVRAAIDVQLDATQLPFPSNSIDVIVCCEVIEHIPDVGKAISEIDRVLKPGGKLVITWPFNYMMHELPYDFVRFTEFGFQYTLSHTKLHIDFIVRRGGICILLLALAEMLFNGLATILGRIPLLGRPLSLFFGKALNLTFYGIYSSYLKIFWRRQMPRMAVGEKLKGPFGQLNFWTLGYCAMITKA